MKQYLKTLAAAGALLALSNPAQATTSTYQSELATARSGWTSISASYPAYSSYIDSLFNAMGNCESSFPSGYTFSSIYTSYLSSGSVTGLEAWGTCLYNQLYGGSYATTAAPQMRAQTTATVTQVSTRIANIMRPSTFTKKKVAELHDSMMGIASGEASGGKVGVWGNVRHINSESTASTGGFDGRNNSWLVGSDVRVMQSLLVGLTVSQDYANYSMTTLNRDSLATSVTPYVGYLFNNHFSMDALLGHTWLNNTQDTKAGAAAVGTFEDANRWFTAVSANGYLPLGADWLLSGKLGYMYSHEKPKSTDALKLGQVSAGVELSYLTPLLEPYLGATYAYDSTATKFSTVSGTSVTNSDRDDVRLTAGVRANLNDSFKGDIAVESVQGRDQYNETSVTANVRYEF
ncbi:MAG: autotransporter outer membrane beta-barrel domain-containing protein [Magnetococcales bacterium]|nr:autotransporter outer membrane beta-barrel domain-containing protein [Magnetococcales bacterium]